MTTAGSTYTSFVAKIFSDLKAAGVSETSKEIEAAAEAYKYQGFDLETIAVALASRQTIDIIKLLAIFHTRGTKITKMRKSLNSTKLKEFNDLTLGIKDNSTSDKTSLTLARISLALPGVSIFVASKIEMNQIAVNALDRDRAIFSVNTVPGVMRYRNLKNAGLIWNCFVLSNASLTMTVSKHGMVTMTEAIKKADSYGKLTYSGTKDDARSMAIAIQILNSIKVDAVTVEAFAEKLGVTLASLPEGLAPHYESAR